MRPANHRPKRQKLLSIRPAPGSPPQPIGLFDLADKIEQCVLAGKVDLAVFYVQQAIKQAPQDGLVWQLSVRVYDAAKNPEMALKYCHKVLSKYPGLLPIMLSQIRALRSLDRYDEALGVAQQAIPQHSEDAEFQSTVGTLYKDLGQMDEALAHFNRAIAISPHFGSPYWNRAELIRDQLSDVELARMEKLCTDEGLSPQDQTSLRFAVAAAYRYRSTIDEEMVHLHEGNRMVRSQSPYVLQEDLYISDRVVEITTKDFLAQREETNIQRKYRPIFIVGMPRCGSTLVEQILFSHSQVATIGESNAFFQALIEQLQPSKHDISAVFDNVPSVDFIRLGDEYLDRVIETLGTCTTFVDKQLLNYVNVGFIRLAFPDARIVHVKRNPMATCLSCYQHLFSATSLGFVYDLGDLAEKFRSYQKTMAHWDRQLGDAIYTLEYERLIENQESVTRDLLEYCELPWEKACLDPSQAQRGIRTTSKYQVRQGIYRDALDRWRAYEGHLQPLLDRLQGDKPAADGSG